MKKTKIKTPNSPAFRKRLFMAAMACLFSSMILFLGIERTEDPKPIMELLRKVVFLGFFIVFWGGFLYGRYRKLGAEDVDLLSLLDEEVLPKKLQLAAFLLSLTIGLIVTLSFREVSSLGAYIIATVWISAAVFSLLLAFHYLGMAIRIK